MSNITDFIRYELYPSLFERINTAFPEHDFKRFPGGWRSKTYMDGTAHKDRHDKTVITTKAPSCIMEQGGSQLSLVDYVMMRDRCEFIQAVKTLANVAGLQIPKGDFNPDGYQREKTTILEACNGYFVWCLSNSPGAEEIRSYLARRGYSEEEIKDMELGFIPSQAHLLKYLREKYKPELVEEVMKLNQGIGSSHKLTIPYRSGGTIKGFKFRTIGNTTPKYLNSTGMDKMGGFFNLLGLKGDKDLTIVEGELDSLHATAKGILNVVATGGSSISTDQVKDAIRMGAKSFTICFDMEPGKEAETAKNTASAIEVILAEGVTRIYIATLPDLGGKTDPDRLIKEQGPETLKQAICEAQPYYLYKLQGTLNKYGHIEEERGLQQKDIDNLLEEIIETASKIPNPVDRDRYKSAFISLDEIRSMGISEESLSVTVERMTTTRDKEAQSKEVKRILAEASQLQEKGETEKALEILDKKAKEAKIIGAKDLLPPLQTFAGILDEIATMPQAYKTGYPSLDKFVGFTPGAITLIAGRPSHGKTTFMFNLVLQMNNLYQDRNFYFFSYEEPVKNISVKLLNRLTNHNLSGYFKEVRDMAKQTNYEFLKSYIKAGRSDIREVEEGKKRLRDLIDSQRLKVIDKNYSVEELYSLIAYLNKREKIGAVIIDYIQRMRTDRRTQDKRTEIAHISDQVLQIAKDSGLPIILGAQLNREGKNRPTLENLKEAGNLEEDANTVLSVYNESREKVDSPDGGNYSDQQVVELEIKALKNREGEVNQKAQLSFDKYTGVISEKEAENPARSFK